MEISLLTVYQMVRQKRKEIKDIIDDYYNTLGGIVSSKLGSDIIIYGMDYDTNELCIGIKEIKKYNKIYLNKYDDELYVYSTELLFTRELLEICIKDFSKLYDELILYKDFKNEYNFNIPTSKDNYVANISEHAVGVTYKDHFDIEGYSYKNDFKTTIEDDEYKDILGKEIWLLNSINVDVNNCPLWIKNELEEQNKEEYNGNKFIRSFKNDFSKKKRI